ncbi:hypothetical protein COLO4_23174 [Corchorus olitorius]|uniref:Uncharacterized protein n=1 Tax=Corchorus olitorius TaxID=93759 RepID=A0A1R3II06_9ROSI|nr:hypothetical protein COLO4_23174 [Corchorus olitorius]
MEGNTKEKNSTPPALLVNDEEEEERINAFFSLVRNIRDAQSRMLIGSQDVKDKDDKGKEKSTWTPSFKLEDFADHHHHHLPNHTVTTLPSSSNTQQQNPKTDHQERQELDLNLSL